MEEKKETIVGGTATGDYTESGNNVHNEDGTFGSKGGSSSPATKRTSSLHKMLGLKKVSQAGVDVTKKPSNLNDVLNRELEFNEMSPGIETLMNYNRHRGERKVKMYTPWTPQEERQVNEVFQRIQKTSSLARNMEVDHILGIFTSGHLMNLFEARGSKGYYGDGRIPASANMFGAEVSINMWSSEDFSVRKKLHSLEKYGYLAEGNISDLIDNRDGAWYGGGTIVLKRENMRNRVTYTVGDSLGGARENVLLPQLLDRPFDSFAVVDRSYTRGRISKILKAQTTSELRGGFGASYIELQFHGEVTPRDIGSICLRPSDLESNQGKQILKFSAMYGIKVYTKKRDRVLYLATLDESGNIKYEKTEA